MTVPSGPLAALRFFRTNGKWLAVSAFTMCVFAMVALYGQLNGSDSYTAMRVRPDITAVGKGVNKARDEIASSVRQLTAKQLPLQLPQQHAAETEPSSQRAARSPLAADGSVEELLAPDRNAFLAAAVAESSDLRRGPEDGLLNLGSTSAGANDRRPSVDGDRAPRADAVDGVNDAVGRPAASAASAGHDSANVNAAAAAAGGAEHRSTPRARRRRARTTAPPPAADVAAAGGIVRNEHADAVGMPNLQAAGQASPVPLRPAAVRRDRARLLSGGGGGNASSRLLHDDSGGAKADGKRQSGRRASAADGVSTSPPRLTTTADLPLLVPWAAAGNSDSQPDSGLGPGLADPVSAYPLNLHWQDRQDREFGRRSDYHGGGSSFVRGTTGPPPPPIQQWQSYDYESAVGVLDIHVEHAPDAMTANLGEPWPMPQHYLTSHTYHAVDLATFKVVRSLTDAVPETPGNVPPASAAAVPWCDRLQRAIVRYTTIVKDTVGKVTGPKIISALPHNTLVISLLTPCSDRNLPHEGMDESYQLRVDAHTMQLTAVEIWGVLRGLETFSQLLHIRDGLAVINETVIRDYPSYGYRGVMLDTARHFLPMQYIKRSLDAMSYNKFNVFHWHIVDDNSFPYESKQFPELHKKGAYSSSEVYSVADVQDIVAYAADRGIRVVPEFDTPGHTRSWGNAYPELLTNCSAEFDPFGAVNPIQQFTYDFLSAFFSEVKAVFPDSYMHIGGDEINYKCWLAVKEIREFMLAHNMTLSEYQYSGGMVQRLNGKQLQGYYTERLLSAMPPNTKKIAWDEAFLAAVQQNLSRSDLVIHVWQQGDMWQQLASQVLNEGFSVIVSACWYLNYISYGIDWHKYYECDLKSFEKYYNIVPEKKAGMLGGSVCLWSEHIDKSNLEPILWPRAIAPAEKLWSSELLVSPLAAQGRFEQQHCRLLRRGVHAAPGNGPGSCLGSMKVKPPM